MPAPAEDFNYLVVSDLHLSEAERNPAGRFFHFDEDFADFLRHYRLSYVGQRRWRLIIDGDFIEFFQMTEAPDPTERLLRGVTLTPADRRFYPGTEWAKSVWKLDRVLRSHPQLLLALSRFLLAGNEIYILRGNHDVEMYWPQVQEHFRLVLAQHHPADTTYLEMKAAIQARLHFLPWFYLDRGLLYVEHGCQYDPFCTNEHNLCPVLPRPTRSRSTCRCPPSPCATSPRVSPWSIRRRSRTSTPSRSYLGRLVAKNPLLALRLPYYYVEMIVRTRAQGEPGLGRGRARGGRPRSGGAPRAGGQARAVRRHAADHRGSSRGPGPPQPVRHHPELRGRHRRGRVLLTVTALWLARPGTAVAGWRRRRASGSMVTGLAASWVKRAKTINDHRNLREIARTIADAVGVRYVVFGHSHQPDAHRLSADEDRWYFNVGTWVPNLQEGHFSTCKSCGTRARRADALEPQAATAGGAGFCALQPRSADSSRVSCWTRASSSRAYSCSRWICSR